MSLQKPGTILDLGRLFEKTFGGRPYVVGKESETESFNGYRISGSRSEQLTGADGSILRESVRGVEIWFPVRFLRGTPEEVFLPYSVVSITTKKTIIKTPLMNRRGSVKEQYNIDDYAIRIKGFLIGENQQFPWSQIEQLRELFELKTSLTLDNALTNIFLKNKGLTPSEQYRVVIENLSFPEVEGGRVNVRPFSMELENDCVFTLELE